MVTFKKIREVKGYKTQVALAKKVGVTKTTVGRWESGKRCPRPDMLIKLSDLMGVSEREIIRAVMEAKTAKGGR